VSPSLHIKYLTRLFRCCRQIVIASLFIAPVSVNTQESLSAGGWQLDPGASSIKFQSVKNGSKVETSSFANFNGTLDENGLATLLVELNSVDTNVDLRNVRMRFLFLRPTAFR